MNVSPDVAMEELPSAQPRPVDWCLVGHIDECAPLREIPIDPFPFQVGRRSGLSLVLPCRTVSGLHAEIYMDAHGLWVQDRQSTNGTFVNGNRVTDKWPLRPGDLVQFAATVFRLGHPAGARMSGTVATNMGERAAVLGQFDRLFEEHTIVPFFQPIVSMGKGEITGFEILCRSRLHGLADPKAMFQAAAEFDLERELSRWMRIEGIMVGRGIRGNPQLFFNTHPAEIGHPGLIESVKVLCDASPSQTVVLEVHEASLAAPALMRDLHKQLKEMGILVAYDDFGAGQARLVELVEVPPDFLKFDRRLLQDIHLSSAARQQALETLVRMSSNLGIQPLAEGIECEGEAEVCRQMGFTLAQGYHFGRPAPLEKWTAQGGAPLAAAVAPQSGKA